MKTIQFVGAFFVLAMDGYRGMELEAQRRDLGGLVGEFGPLPGFGAPPARPNHPIPAPPRPGAETTGRNFLQSSPERPPLKSPPLPLGKAIPFCRIPASRAAAFINLVPVVAVAASRLLVGEPLTPLQCLAALAVAGGVGLSQML